MGAAGACWIGYKVFCERTVERIPDSSRARVLAALETAQYDLPPSRLSLDTLCTMNDYLAMLKLLSHQRQQARGSTVGDIKVPYPGVFASLALHLHSMRLLRQALRSFRALTPRHRK
jgi:hypothetical protein